MGSLCLRTNSTDHSYYYYLSVSKMHFYESFLALREIRRSANHHNLHYRELLLKPSKTSSNLCLISFALVRNLY